MNLMAVLLVASVTCGVAAQGFVRIRMEPLALDPARGECSCSGARCPPGVGCPGTGPAPSPASGAGAVTTRWWYWNRDRWLPRPRRVSSRAAVNGVTQAGATGLSWLFEVANDEDPRQRAMAILAIGHAGPRLDGLPRLIRALADADAGVRRLALLALGEHAGPRARFELVRAMNDGERPGDERSLAVLAYGVAAAIDGDVGGLELRRLAASAEVAPMREVACAADLLLGRGVLAATAARWCLDRGAPLALAVQASIAHTPRCDVRAALSEPLVANSMVIRTAAREQALASGQISKPEVLRWFGEASLEHRARSILAAIGSPAFDTLLQQGLDQSTLRGTCALGYAVHSAGAADAADGLLKMASRSRSQADQPWWLLAAQIVGDIAAVPRARAILQDSRAPIAMRVAAVDVLAMAGGEALHALRLAVALDPAAAVRLQAADGLARHGGAADVAALQGALSRATDKAEIASLLISLGRSRSATFAATLHRHCVDDAVSSEERAGAWFGLQLQLRWSGESQLGRLPHGIAFGHLSSAMLALADRSR
ncbi:MAG: HEAT repeat domain-containing protein [Planctomycetes bacterium]|nr:HEAT repeat domain-containing protein [Planctomycetota bacterium]